MKLNNKLLLIAALFALVLPLVFTGTAGAKYMGDGAVQNGTTGGWNLPTDFVCIVGIHADGTLDIADGVTSSRNCIYLQTGNMNGGTAFNLSTITTQDACTVAGFTDQATQCTAAGKPASCCTDARTGTCTSANYNPEVGS